MGVRGVAHGLRAKHPAVAPPVRLALGAAPEQTSAVIIVEFG